MQVDGLHFNGTKCIQSIMKIQNLITNVFKGTQTRTET